MMKFSLLLLCLSFSVSNQLTVHSQWGPITGRQMNLGETVVYAFKNIPFTRPPIGDLRFKITEKEPKWTPKDRPWNSTRVFSHVVCPQISSHNSQITFIGHEDCLYLDVYTRKHAEGANVPVIVYFHGGGFDHGSKEEYGPDFLLRFADVVLVIPNYRLGILGFLKSNDGKLVPGNLGLWDQYMSLRWVKQNIHLFGGDPKKVTIAGHEAGAVSVGLHVMSPVSAGLFRRAISVSGSAFSHSLFGSDGTAADSVFFRVTSYLNCSSTLSTDETISCLQAVDLNVLMDIQMNLENVKFLPTKDNSETSFVRLLNTPYNKRQHNVNYLFAYAKNEAAVEVAKSFPTALKFQNLDKMIEHYLKPYFENIVNFKEIVKAVKYHYLKGVFIPSFESMEARLATIMTDFLYRSPIEYAMQHRMKGKTFLYVLKAHTLNLCGSPKRGCYGDEFYLFNKSMNHSSDFFGNIFIGERTLISKTLAKIWEIFSDIGYPDAQEKWKPWNNLSRNYGEISDLIQTKQSPNSGDSEFWNSLVMELKQGKNETYVESMESMSNSSSTSFGTRGAAGMSILFGVLCVALIGLVVIMKRRKSGILPVSSPKDFRIASEWT